MLYIVSYMAWNNQFMTGVLCREQAHIEMVKVCDPCRRERFYVSQNMIWQRLISIKRVCLRVECNKRQHFVIVCICVWARCLRAHLSWTRSRVSLAMWFVGYHDYRILWFWHRILCAQKTQTQIQALFQNPHKAHSHNTSNNRAHTKYIFQRFINKSEKCVHVNRTNVLKAMACAIDLNASSKLIWRWFWVFLLNLRDHIASFAQRSCCVHFYSPHPLHHFRNCFHLLSHAWIF